MDDEGVTGPGAPEDPWPMPPPPPPRPVVRAPAWPGAASIDRSPLGPAPASSAWGRAASAPPALPRLPGRLALARAAVTAAILALLGVPAMAGAVRDATRAVIGVDARLALSVFVAVAVGVTVSGGWRWLRAAAASAGAPGVASFLHARSAAPPPRASDQWLPPLVTPLPPASARIPAASRLVVAATVAGIGGAALLVASTLALRSRLVEDAGVVAADGVVPLAWAALVGAAAVVLAAGLVPAVLRAVDRRVFAAAREREGRDTPLPSGRSPLPALAIAVVVLLVAAAPSFGDAVPGSVAAGDRTENTCALEEPWVCHTTSVPADVADPTGVRVDLAWAIHPATTPDAGVRRVLVLVDGGPGASGIEDAEWMFDDLDARVQARYDVVAFDARGTGGSDPRECPTAGKRFRTAPLMRSTVRTFAADCVRESGVGEAALPRFGSRQIAADIDSIRAVLGVDRVALYGISYGTVVAQQYAAAYRDRVERLVLDAPIDRVVPSDELWVTAAQGFQAAVDLTLEACGDDTRCATALPNPRHTIDRVYQQLGSAHSMSDLVVQPDGSSRRELMTTDDWEALLYQSMYSQSERMRLLRALSAIDHGDKRAMLRLVDVFGGASRPAEFAYYATWCADARLRADGDEQAAFEAFQAVATKRGLGRDGLLDIAWTLAPCLYWPVEADALPPADFAGVDTLILTSTADPITPPSEAHAILGRHPEARLVETKGGAHGSLGESCPMDRVAEFLVDGRLPVAPTSVCEGRTITSFVPLARSPAASAEDAAGGVYDELWASPEVLWWDGTTRLDIGCTEAGTATIKAMGANGHADVTFDGCSWAANAAFDGEGWLDLYSGDATFTLRSARGTLVLRATGSGVKVTGNWDGAIVTPGG